MIQFRKATEGDSGILTEYRIRFLLDLMGPQNPKVVENLQVSLLGYFQKASAAGECLAYVAEVGPDVAGTGVLVFREQPGNFKNPSGRVGYILSMYTVPEHRKKGICTEILKRLMADAEAQGVHSFELHATHDGQGIYAAHGFKVHGEPTMRR